MVPLPSADVLVMGRILHNWDHSIRTMLLEKACRAISPGGALIVYDPLIDDERRTAYDAQATCGSLDKRLCYESEWVSACEGPDKLPFPYGYARDNTKCNIDNQWIKPSLPHVYSKDAQGLAVCSLTSTVTSWAMRLLTSPSYCVGA